MIRILKYLRNRTYSYIVKRQFSKCGSNFYIESPVYLIGGKSIEIGNDFFCFERLRLEAFHKHNRYKFSPKIKIGNNVSINYDCHIGAINKIIIGNDVLLASRVFITDHFHGDINKRELSIPPNRRKLFSKGPVIIEDGVWIGEGVSIMPNVSIGKNCIIGANSVVTKSFPPNSIIGGIPAKLIRQL
jgi:acetyltransferase-like isoleucine patch superfamily enzyme